MKHKANELVVGTRYWLRADKTCSGEFKELCSGKYPLFTNIEGEHDYETQSDCIGFTNFLNLSYEVQS